MASEPMICPACKAPMLPARLLKGYPKTGKGSGRRTCPLHGPRGRFRHIAPDRLLPDTRGEEA